MQERCETLIFSCPIRREAKEGETAYFQRRGRQK
jgi:hypothetical protein